MDHLVSATIACLLGVALPLVASAADSEHDRLARGDLIISQKAVRGSDMPEAMVKAVIDAPGAKLWKVIDLCDNYKNFMPRTKESKELSRKGEIIHCRVTIDMPFPISDLTATTRAVHTVRKGLWKRAWKLAEGEYKINTGSWTLSPFDGSAKRTLVVYRVHAEPNIPVPIWIMKKAARSTLPDLIDAVGRAAGAPPRPE